MRDLDVVVYRLEKPKAVWPLFAPHHYLRQDLSNGARAWLGVVGDTPVAFSSIINMHGANRVNVWREHRTVVLPDYQGLGIGYRLVEWVGEWVLSDGGRLYSRTAHPRVGEARMDDPKWRETGKNLKMRKAHWSGAGQADTTRKAYSHEYVGLPLTTDSD